jgi:Ca2+-binding EF-hand superfamily protein
MTTIDSSNPLTSMLASAFDRLDKNGSSSLDRSEFKSLYEMLKPGIADDGSGVKTVSENAEFRKMDRNSDGQVTKDEMQSTDTLMPAALTDESLQSIIKYLGSLNTFAASTPASHLAGPDALMDKSGATAV